MKRAFVFVFVPAALLLMAAACAPASTQQPPTTPLPYQPPKTQTQTTLKATLGRAVQLKYDQTASFDTDDQLKVQFSRVVRDDRSCGSRKPRPEEKAMAEFRATLVHPQASGKPTTFTLDESSDYTIFGFNLVPGKQPHEYRVKFNKLTPVACSLGAKVESLKDSYEATITVSRVQK